MSELRANSTETTYRIKGFLGVNESDGNTKLKPGEAADMANWRITDSGCLQRRPGTKRVIGLSAGYTLAAGAEKALLATTDGDKTLLLRTACTADEAGTHIGGSLVTATPATMGEHVGEYYEENGHVYRISRATAPDRAPLPTLYTVYGELMEATGGTERIQGLWSGVVGGKAVFMAAAGNKLWQVSETDGVWSRALIGNLWSVGTPTMQYDVALFGLHDKLYCKHVYGYFVWDGESLKAVEPYVPVVTTATAPAGGGTALERVNLLTRKRRQRFSADGVHSTFKLAEKQISVNAVVENGAVLPYGNGGYVYSSANGTVTFKDSGGSNRAPAAGSNNVEITYTATDVMSNEYTGDGARKVWQLPYRADDIASAPLLPSGYSVYVYINSTGRVYGTDYTLTVDDVLTVTFEEAPASGATVKIDVGLKYTDIPSRVEMFSGSADNRVFFYGNGAKVYYSGINEYGQSDPTYIPDLNEIEVGDSAPVTALCRHYSRLLAFKAGSAYSIYYQLLTLADGSATDGFYITGVNRAIGCDAVGQAVLADNNVRTPDGRSIYEWKGNRYGTVTDDQRNAERISQRVQKTLAGFDYAATKCFFDPVRHEYYAVCNGTAVVHNTELDAWSVYTGFPADCFAVWNDELYLGRSDGWIVRVSEDYSDDDGAAIACNWRSGSLDFDRPWVRKYSAELWLSLRPEAERRSVTASFLDDAGNSGEKSLYIAPRESGHDPVSTRRARLKARHMSHYRLGIFSNDDQPAVVEDAAIQVKYLADVKRGSVE